MNKKIYQLIAVLFIGLAITGLFNTSCKKDDNGSTKITLLSYGPSPVLRGGDLKFIGENLDQVTSVILPNNIEIKTFKSQSSELLVITLPQETVEGIITLKTPQGDITTKTILGISEPIRLDTITPTKVRPGDTISIKGEYLNLIKEVTLSVKKTIPDSLFVTHTKTSIRVVVPGDAQTGKVTLSNGAEEPILIESLSDLEVTLPAITSISPNPVKAGEALTIVGTDLDLANFVVFGGGRRVADTSFVSHTATKIVVLAPYNSKDGKITLIGASTVEVYSSNSLEMVVPTITTISPSSELKNNQALTVTGTNLDLITKAVFGGSIEATPISGGSTTSITFTIPSTAVDGTISFSTNSEKSVVSTQSFTYVKPTITSFTEDGGGAYTGTLLTIAGTDLDLVSSLTFEGGIEGKIQPGGTATSMKVKIPAGVTEGARTLTLTTTNGATVNSSTVTVNIKHNNPIITVMPTNAIPGEILTIKGKNLGVITQVYFTTNKLVTMYGTKTDSVLEVYVPAGTKTGPLRFMNTAGDYYQSEDTVLVPNVEPVQNAAWVYFDFDAGDCGIGWNDLGSVENDPLISISNKYYHVNATTDGSWKVYFARNWGKFSAAGVDPATGVVKMDVNIVSVTSGMVLKLRQSNSDGTSYWYVWKVSDQFPNGTDGWKTLTIPLSQFKDSDGNGTGTITDVSKLGSEYGLTAGWGAGTINMYIDNVRFEMP